MRWLQPWVPSGYGVAELPAEWSDLQLTETFRAYCATLGELQPQNHARDLIVDVVDRGKLAADADSRFYESREALELHTDGADITALLCLQPATVGGDTTVADATVLHDLMLKERPELAAELYKLQPFDWRDLGPENGLPWFRLPVFEWLPDRGLRVFLLRAFSESSQRYPGAPKLTALAREGMQWLIDHAPPLTERIALKRGDVLLVDNLTMLHGRTTFEGQRHLQRIWIKR